MSSVVQIKKNQKTPQSKSKATFNRLRKKIETLERKLHSVHKELDECLQLYLSQIEPKEQALAEVFTEVVKMMYDHYKNVKRQTKKERHVLKNIILEKIHHILQLTSINPQDSELKTIIKDLEGIDYDALFTGEMDRFKVEMSEQFKEQGIDIDLSSINPEDDETEILRKISEAMSAAKDHVENSFSEKPKTKKQLELELKEKQLETLQKQGLSSIYKQLAKAFHPDLEQDPIQKAEKEQLMKQLTVAYDNKDLHSLLHLEIEWMNRTGNQKNPTQTEDQLKIYNLLLKEQVETLQSEISMAPTHPKYFSIRRFLNESGFKTIFMLNILSSEMSNELKNFQGELSRLKKGIRLSSSAR